jgi:hypothetical protein
MVDRARRTGWSLLAGLLCWALAGCGPAGASALDAPGPSAETPTSTPSSGAPGTGPSAPPSGAAGTGPSAPAEPLISYPVQGAATFDVAPTGGPVVGTGGSLLSYRVVVERGIQGISAADFAGQVSAVLSDSRGWTGTGKWRLRLVPAGERYDFTIYLATPATRDVLCGHGYDRYTSCREKDRVVLNVARWVHGVPNYPPGLEAYRQYMVNHETGHRLYNGHELCPGPGKPAPVMQQQTLGLHGCAANSWPVLDGRMYHGRSGQYDDQIPRDPA